MIHAPVPARRLPAAVALAFAMVVVLSACNRGGAPAGGPPGGGMPPMAVNVRTVQSQAVPVALDVVATLEGLREVEVRARVAGTLQQQLYREGEPVAAGAALFRIDRAPLEISVDTARAALAQAEARVEQARREQQRLASLVADKAVSQREADDAGSSAKTAEAALLAARAQVRDAQLNLGYTDITAPIAGVAQRALRSVGTLVSPSTDSGLLTTIVQVDPIRVRFALSEAEATQLRQARGRGTAQVRLVGADGQPSKESGRVDFAGSVVDRTLGTVQVRAEIANPGGQWLPGQFVRAQIVIGEQPGFLVPQAAVLSGDQGRFVWVMGADGKAAPRPVEVGAWQGRDWVIRSGLANGDKVIVDNLLKLRPGAAVQLAPPPGAAPAASAAAPAASAASAAPAASRQGA